MVKFKVESKVVSLGSRRFYQTVKRLVEKLGRDKSMSSISDVLYDRLVSCPSQRSAPVDPKTS